MGLMEIIKNLFGGKKEEASETAQPAEQPNAGMNENAGAGESGQKIEEEILQ